MIEILASRRLLVRVAAAAALCIPLGVTSAWAAAAEPKGAEYAVRWNARDGGPGTINDVLVVLKSRATRVRQFRNDYYDLPPTAGAPEGFATILRRRVEEGVGAELTWKQRGDCPLAEWSCPLREAGKTRAEVDVTFGGADATTRAFSYSCTSDDADAAAAALAASIRACPATVFRRDAGNLKLEEWHLPGDVLIIEVSMTSENAPGPQELFRTRIVVPLLAAGIVPRKESKTDLSSRCP